MSSEGGKHFKSAEDGGDQFDEPCEIIKSQRGGEKLAHEGYLYYKDKQTPETCYWVCVRYRENDSGLKCLSRAKTQVRRGKHYIVSAASHYHLPSALDVETERYRNLLKRKARERLAYPATIMRHCAAQAPVEGNWMKNSYQYFNYRFNI